MTYNTVFSSVIHAPNDGRWYRNKLFFNFSKIYFNIYSKNTQPSYCNRNYQMFSLPFFYVNRIPKISRRRNYISLLPLQLGVDRWLSSGQWDLSSSDDKRGCVLHILFPPSHWLECGHGGGHLGPRGWVHHLGKVEQDRNTSPWLCTDSGRLPPRLLLCKREVNVWIYLRHHNSGVLRGVSLTASNLKSN